MPTPTFLVQFAHGAVLLCGLAIAVGCDRHVETSQSIMLRVPEAVVEVATNGPVSLYPVSVGGEEAGALFAPAPSRIRFKEVSVPDKAHLEFAVGVIDTDDSSDLKADSARFSVDIKSPSGRIEREWSLAVSLANGNAQHWNDVSVDLAEYAGQKVDVILSTEPIGGQAGRAAWRSPILRGTAPTTTRERTEILHRTVKNDLLKDMAPPISLGTFDRFDSKICCVAGLAEAYTARVEMHRAVDDEVPDPSGKELNFRVRVPERAAIEIGGEVLRGPNSRDSALGPVSFRVVIEGEVVLQRTVGTPGKLINFGGRETLDIAGYNGLSFSEQIALDGYAGRTIELVLYMDSSESDDVSWWTEVSVLQSEDRARRTARDERNLLIVLVDTLRADHLGLYGYKRRPVSPRLDAFGLESLVFDQAIAQAPWTQPSVASLFTGLQPLEHGVVGGVGLNPAIETLASTLQSQGFTTVALSANPIISRRAGFHRGFEEFIEIPEFRAEAVTDLFDLWLAENSGWQWFAYLHYMDPHQPNNPPPPFNSKYTTELGAADAADRKLSKRAENRRRRVALYDGEIEYFDTHFGRLLEMLEYRGVLDNTIIVFVGDHGELHGEHGKLDHSEHLYDETIHVPLIVFAPGLIEPGRATGTVEVRGVQELVLDLLNIRKPDRPMSLLREARTGEGSPAFSHTALARGDGGYVELAAISDGSWRYIRRLDTNEVELYDRSSDPRETKNLVDSNVEEAARLSEVLEFHLNSAPNGVRERDPGLVEQLRAMGYVE